MVKQQAWWLRVLDEIQVVVISISFLVLIGFLSIHLVYFFAGTVVCALTAKVLKRIIRQPRPDSLRQKTSYGMPSSHSQVMAFFSMYCHLALPSAPSPVAPPPPPLLVKAVLYTTTALVVWSRVYLGHHSVSQVTVGCLVGVTMACGWHCLWQQALVHLLPS